MSTVKGELFIKTPLIESLPLSQLLGVPVYLKLENTQPCGSFKLRGIGRFCQKAVSNGCKYLVTSSGGNAGLAVTYSAHRLGVKACVIVPSNSSAAVRQRLEDEGALVEVHGHVWNHANERAHEVVKQTQGAVYVHPFDHPDIWAGHSTMIEEIVEDLGPDVVPSTVVACVGGGGLACGVIEGMKRVGWDKIPLVLMETDGTDCFNQSFKAGKKVVLEALTSIANCLGSLEPCDKLVSYIGKVPIISEIVSDREAVDACLKFADDHCFIVETACGASLAAVYSGLLSRLRRSKKISNGPVIMIVCGGSGATREQLATWKKDFGL